MCEPRSVTEEQTCASTILSKFARLAYRRPTTSADVRTLIEFFDRGRREGGSFVRASSSRSSARLWIPTSCCACIAILPRLIASSIL